MDTSPTEVPFEHGDSDQFTSSGEIRINGTLFVGHEAIVLDPDAAYLILEYEQVTREYFYEDGMLYTKYTTNVTEDRASIRSSLENDSEVVYYGQDEDGTVLVAEREGTYVDKLGPVRVRTISSLILPEYEQVEKGNDSEYAVYEPSSAWVKVVRSVNRVVPEPGVARPLLDSYVVVR